MRGLFIGDGTKSAVPVIFNRKWLSFRWYLSLHISAVDNTLLIQKGICQKYGNIVTVKILSRIC
jgi:hypothetical protein